MSVNVELGISYRTLFWISAATVSVLGILKAIVSFWFDDVKIIEVVDVSLEDKSKILMGVMASLRQCALEFWSFLEETGYGRRLVGTFGGLELVYRVVSMPSMPPHEAKHCTMKVLAIGHAIFAGVGGALVIWNDPELRRQTWDVATFRTVNGLFVSTAGTEAARTLTSVTVGFFLWELAHVRDWAPSSKSEHRTMIIHHVVSCILWPLSCHLRIAHFFLIHFEATELSSPCLQLRWFARRWQKGELTVSAAFALSFFAVRTSLVVPMLRAAWIAQVWNGAVYPHLNFTVRLLSTLSLPMPFFLNILWTVQILKMIAKTIRRCNKMKKIDPLTKKTTLPPPVVVVVGEKQQIIRHRR